MTRFRQANIVRSGALRCALTHSPCTAYAPVSQIHMRHRGLHARVLHQNGGLLQLGAQRVTIKRVASEGACAHDQVVLQGAAMPTFTPNS